MYWVIYRHNEPIPQELKYPDYQSDKDDTGQTPLMYWIIQGHNADEDRRIVDAQAILGRKSPQQPIPQELLYPGYPTDRDKRG